ncbi:hypothetical protein [Pelagibacterium sediminicola]|uniref:hypothetical protein n=1 Tax=Pelagibacterium sediminicola TaxID=2248761 RepID=UPI000E314F62|nr:hypothetical protein [Pelagibacterium sediminicola]
MRCERFTDDVIAGLKEKLAHAVDSRDHSTEIFDDELREVIDHMERMLAKIQEYRAEQEKKFA